MSGGDGGGGGNQFDLHLVKNITLIFRMPKHAIDFGVSSSSEKLCMDEVVDEELQPRLLLVIFQDFLPLTTGFDEVLPDEETDGEENSSVPREQDLVEETAVLLDSLVRSRFLEILKYFGRIKARKMGRNLE